MDEITTLRNEISQNVKKNNPIAKQKWYRMGEYLLAGKKVKWHPTSKVAARRTYLYYLNVKGWDGPTPR